jgi:hypothetical protein
MSAPRRTFLPLTRLLVFAAFGVAAGFLMMSGPDTHARGPRGVSPRAFRDLVACVDANDDAIADQLMRLGVLKDLCSGGCAGAEGLGPEIFCGDLISGSTVGEPVQDVDFCGTSSSSPGVWYSFVGTGDLVTLTTCNMADYDTKLSVYTCELECVTGNDDDFGGGCGLTSTVMFEAIAGETYNVLVHGFGAGSGAFDLSVSCGP